MIHINGYVLMTQVLMNVSVVMNALKMSLSLDQNASVVTNVAIRHSIPVKMVQAIHQVTVRFNTYTTKRGVV